MMSLQNIAKKISKSIQNLTQNVYPQVFTDQNDDDDVNAISTDKHDSTLYPEKVPMILLHKCSSKKLDEGEISVSISNLNLKHNHCQLDDVNLCIPKGKIFALVGPPESGKSIFLRCIVGYLKPHCGEILLLNKTYRSNDLLIPGKNVGYMPQESGLFEYMTISEILFYYGRLYRMDKNVVKMRICKLTEHLELPVKSARISCLSWCQKKLVSLLIALIHRPPIIVLDEPTSGVDPFFCEKIWTLFDDVHTQHNSTFIIATSRIQEIKRCHLIGFIKNGKLVHQNSPDNLLKTFSTLEAAFVDLCSKEDIQLINFEKSFSYSNQSVVKFGRKIRKKDSRKLKKNRLKKVKKNYHSKCQFKENLNRLIGIVWTLFVRYTKNYITSVNSLIYLYLIPPIIMLIAASCLGGQLYDIQTGLVNNEIEPDISELFIEHMNEQFFKLKNYTNFKTALEDVVKKKLKVLIKIQDGFTEAILDRIYEIDRISDIAINRSQIVVITDVSDKILFDLIFANINRNFPIFIRNMIRLADGNSSSNMENSNFLSNPPIKVKETIYGNYDQAHYELRNHIFPGAIINIVFSVSYTLFAFSLMSERFSQSFERNYVAGVKSYQMLLALAASRILCMIPMFFIITILPVKMIGFPILVKDIIRSMPLILVVSLAGYSVGMVIAVLCSSFAIMVPMLTANYSVGLFTSGTFWPLESVNSHLRNALLLYPTTMPIKALRNIFYKKAPIFHGDANKAFTLMTIWITVALLISTKFFKKPL